MNATSTRQGYVVRVDGDASNITKVWLWHDDGVGAQDDMGGSSGLTYSHASDVTLTLYKEGGNIKFDVNGTNEINVSDTYSLTGGNPGFCVKCQADLYAFDDWTDATPGGITHYYGVYTNGNGASATDANVKAGTGTGYVTSGNQADVSPGTEQSFTISGLTADTQYDLEWVATDAGGDTRGTAVNFRTKRATGSIVVAVPPPIVRS
jgi:hypothetical protein